MVWGRPAVDKRVTDAASPAVSPTLDAPVEPVVSVESAASTPVAEQDTPPSTPEIAIAAIAAAAASIPIAAEMPEPIAATTETAETPQSAAAVPPLSRRARRAPQAFDQPTLPPIEDETTTPAESVVAEFSAVAPARAVPVTLPPAVQVAAEPFILIEPEQIIVAEPVVEAEPFVEAESVAATEPFVLLEPVAEPVVESPTTESIEESWAAASDSDEFEAAARLFSFTGETPIQTADEPAESQPAEPHAARRRPRPSSGASFRRVSAASFSIGVMGIVGLLTVGMTTPAEAVAAAGGSDMPMSVLAPATTELEVDADAIQAYAVPATVADVPIERSETYSTVTTAQLAAQSGIKNFSNFFVNDPNSAIQWPFAVGVPISYGFGMRSGRMHEGVDFTPGAGSPIQAIAEGVVRVATNSGGAFGVSVIIDHQIDGQLVSSHYAHMQYGSLQVAVGQHVTVGTIIGRTGNTGRSYGAHTHFEILMNGTTPIDPIPWLRAHAGG